MASGLETGGVFAGTITPSSAAAGTGGSAIWAQSDLPVAVAERDPYNIMIGEPVRGAPPNRDRAISTCLRASGLADHGAKRMPFGAVGRHATTRSTCADLTYERPPVRLFLDGNPFRRWNAGIRAAMQELAAELLSGAHSVFVVTHDPAEAARLADHILILCRRGPHKSCPSGPAPPHTTRHATAPEDLVPAQMRAVIHLLRCSRNEAAVHIAACVSLDWRCGQRPIRGC